MKENPIRKHPFFFSTILLFLISLMIRFFAYRSRTFSDFFNMRIAAFFRFLTAKAFGFLPFSVAEALILLIPLWLFLLIFFGVRAIRSRKHFFRYVRVTLSFPLWIYILFIFTYAVGYQGTPLAERIALPEVAVNKDNLYATAEWAAGEAAALAPLFETDETGATAMPYSWREMNEKLNEAYASLSDTLPFLQSHNTTLKPILLSDPMTYTGIVGVYTFFTGESNVNTTFCDYSTVFTAAHEMAHQRGIAPENEANFIAFLACTESEDPYLRYAGYMNLLDYLSNAIYRTDKETYRLFAALYTPEMRKDILAYQAIYDAHKNETVSGAANSVNNSFLQSQGTPGTISYSLVVTLAVQYYESMKSP